MRFRESEKQTESLNPADTAIVRPAFSASASAVKTEETKRLAEVPSKRVTPAGSVATQPRPPAPDAPFQAASE